MLLSNKLIYSDRLRCGNDEVAKRGLELPDNKFLKSLHADAPCGDTQCWIERLLDKECVHYGAARETLTHTFTS